MVRYERTAVAHGVSGLVRYSCSKGMIIVDSMEREALDVFTGICGFANPFPI